MLRLATLVLTVRRSNYSARSHHLKNGEEVVRDLVGDRNNSCWNSLALSAINKISER
jgi:hypothetical protein